MHQGIALLFFKTDRRAGQSWRVRPDGETFPRVVSEVTHTLHARSHALIGAWSLIKTLLSSIVSILMDVSMKYERIS